MNIYSILSSNFDSALNRAKKEISSSVKVLYQKEVISGLVPKKLIEIGVYSPVLSQEKLDSSLINNSNSAVILKNYELLKNILNTYDCSMFLSRLIEDDYLHSSLEGKKTDDIYDYAFKSLSSHIHYSKQILSKTPSVIFLNSPYYYDISNIVKVLTFCFNDSTDSIFQEISLLNVGCKTQGIEDVKYIYNCDDLSNLGELLTSIEIKGRVIVNISKQYFFQQKLHNTIIDIIKNSNSINFSVNLVLPSYAKTSETKILSESSSMYSSIIVSDFKEGRSFGNIISISEELALPILFFEENGACTYPLLCKLNNI